jgi:hypothetical protein
LLAPGEEPADRDHVGHARIPVANGGGKELEEAAGGMLTGIGDNAGHRDGGMVQDGNTGGPADGQLAGRIRVGLGVINWHWISVT